MMVMVWGEDYDDCVGGDDAGCDGGHDTDDGGVDATGTADDGSDDTGPNY